MTVIAPPPVKTTRKPLPPPVEPALLEDLVHPQTSRVSKSIRGSTTV